MISALNKTGEESASKTWRAINKAAIMPAHSATTMFTATLLQN